jgi:hypothetical protein
MADVYRFNYILEILTPTPRRLTTYSGYTADGRRGLIVSGVYFQSAIVEWPGIEETDAVAPVQIEISIGNAHNDYNDLYWNAANYRKDVIIQKVNFTGATWSEALAPTFTLQPWFEGRTGKPSLQGERLKLICNADMGRRGRSPRTASRKVMLSTQPLSAGSKLIVVTTIRK